MIKKVTLFYVLLTGAQQLSAQWYMNIYETNPEYGIYNLKPNSGIVKVTGFTVLPTFKNKIREVHFTPEGRISMSEVRNKKGKIKTTEIYTYNDSGYRTSQMVYRKGRFVKGWKFSYENKKLVKSERFYKDSLIPTSTQTLVYNNAGKPTLVSVVNKKGKEVWRTEYTYYENGSTKSTVIYSMGKEKQRLSYECSPTGEPEKKETRICQNRTYDADSNVTEVYLSMERNKEVKVIYEKNKKNQLLRQTRYNERGEITTRKIYTYTNDLLTLVVEEIKGKPARRQEYTYDANKMLTSSVTKNQAGKTKHWVAYIYQ